MRNNIIYEAHLQGSPNSITQEQIKNIYIQMENFLCKIIHHKERGTGFFCKIPFPDEFTLLPVLITCNHVLNNKVIFKEKKINFILNNTSYSLPIDDSRKVYSNKVKDTTIIEIKKVDNIPNIFLDLDENLFKPNLKETYLNKSVYILHFAHGRTAKYSPGVISIFRNADVIGHYNILYSCSTNNGSSGGPIINPSNYKIIGLHKGYDHKEKLNLGIIIKSQILDFYYLYKKKQLLINQHNFQPKEKDKKNDNNFYEYNFQPKEKYDNNNNNNNFEEDNFLPNKIYEKYYNNLEENNSQFQKIYLILPNLFNEEEAKYDEDENEEEEEEEEENEENEENEEKKVYKEQNNNMNKENNNSNDDFNFHEHPLNYCEQINDSCSICLQNIENAPGYRCNQCEIILCLDCRFKINYETKRKNIHLHPLELKSRNKWTCNMCGLHYHFNKRAFFSCGICQFNVCDICYFGKPNELVKPIIDNNILIHNGVFHYYNNLFKQCYFCKKSIKNNEGYKCNNCKIILCLDCNNKIFHKEKINDHHEHNLRLELRRNWLCNICKNEFENTTSFYCKDCDFDICYNCYFNNI